MALLMVTHGHTILVSSHNFDLEFIQILADYLKLGALMRVYIQVSCDWLL